MRAAFAPPGGIARRRRDEWLAEFESFDDLLSSTEQDAALTVVGSGTSARATAVAPSGTYGLNRRGLLQFGTGSTSSGRTHCGMSASAQPLILPREAEVIRASCEVYPESLSDGTNTFSILCGLSSDASSASPNDGAMLKYTHGTTSGAWHLYAASSGSSTTVSTGLAVAASRWYRLEVELHGAARMIRAWVNGQELAGLGNLTYYPANAVGFVAGIYKSVGNTARSCVFDWVRMRHRMRMVDAA